MLYSKRTAGFTLTAIAMGLIGSAVLEPMCMIDYAGSFAFPTSRMPTDPNSETVEFKAWLIDSSEGERGDSSEELVVEWKEIVGSATDLDSRRFRSVLVEGSAPER